MGIKSIQFNAVMNTIRMFVTLVFPMVAFPYLSRTIGPVGTGWVNFTLSFSGYFVLLAGIGIPYYGVRQIAKVRDDAGELTATTQEIFIIHLFSSLAASFVYYLVISYKQEFLAQGWMFYISGALIPISALSVEWLFQGKEDYLYITIRTIFFSIISLVSIFVFVTNPEHYSICAFISVASTSGAAFLNFWQARKIIFGHRVRPFLFLMHIRSMSTSYAIILISSLYLSLDVVFLGFFAKPEEVGYYTAASKFLTIVWSLVSSFGAVLIPRLSNYSENGKDAEFTSIVNKSIAFTIMICFPTIVTVVILSKDIILIFAGLGFLSAVDCLMITIPGLLFASLANIFAWQILFPKRQDLNVINSMLVAASVSLISNYFLIGKYAHIGAAYSKVFAEFAVCFVLYFKARKCCELKVIVWSNLKLYFIATVSLIIFIYFVLFYIIDPVWRLLITIPFGALVYFSALVLAREEMVFGFVHGFSKKYFAKKGA